jgi:hypothetical protein
LEAENPYLRELNDWYRQNAARLGLATHAYYELEKVRNVVLVVSPSSADPGVEGCIALGLDGDHFEICRPQLRASPAYAGSLRFIRACLELGSNGLSSRPDLDLEPATGSHHVYLGTSKYQKNAPFSFAAGFLLHSGDSATTVLAFEGLYAAYGCYALNGPPRLSVGDEEAPVAEDFYGLLRPIQIPRGETIRLSYSREVRPPLMEDEPASCDLGDLEVRVCYKSGIPPSRVASWYFRYGAGGILQPARGLRSVPHFTDGHLKALREVGRISQAEMEALLSFPPQRRYLAARSDNPSDQYLGVPNKLRQLLRGILQEAP